MDKEANGLVVVEKTSKLDWLYQSSYCLNYNIIFMHVSVHAVVCVNVHVSSSVRFHEVHTETERSLER